MPGQLGASLTLIENLVRWTGGLFALLILAVILFGIWQGMRLPTGLTSGSSATLLRSPIFYLIVSIGFFGASILLWIPLAITFSLPARIAALILGSLLYFPGMAFTLWGRLALGRMYFVSSGLGAQLFRDHQLVTHGPYAIVRHPMYVGIAVAGIGGLLLYQTWTMIFLLVLPFGLLRRAWMEEQVLAAEFGDRWIDYCRRVPGWIPGARFLFPWIPPRKE